MIGDRHPDFPLLYAVEEDENGEAIAYATTGPWFGADDPRLILTDRERPCVQRRQTSTGITGISACTSDTQGA